MKKPTVEYRWEAYREDGTVVKRGPVREDLTKVVKYAKELEDGIFALRSPGVPNGKWRLAPYWYGLYLRIVTRTITPWEAMQSQDSEVQV